jgi:hypothetical protein
MGNFSKIFVLLLAVTTAGLTWVLQSGAQDTSPTRDTKKAPAESSLLLQPPTNSSSKVDVPLRPGATRDAEVLPPPKRPSTQPGARQLNRLVRQPFLRPAEPEPGERSNVPPPATQPPVAEEVMPAPGGTDVIVRPTPHISTDTDRGARRMYRDSGEVELWMVVKNPADGCLYEIPLCVPGCCTGEPIVDEWRGLFGRGVVEYCWECGFTATVKFRHILGDVKVEYDG